MTLSSSPGRVFPALVLLAWMILESLFTFSRTACSTGGAPPYHVLKAAILKETPEITMSELDKRIGAEEYHQARWINKHDILAIYSP